MTKRYLFGAWTKKKLSLLAKLFHVSRADIKVRGTKMNSARPFCPKCKKKAQFSDVVFTELKGNVHCLDFMKNVVLGITPGRGSGLGRILCLFNS